MTKEIILAINPDTAFTKISLYERTSPLFKEIIYHSSNKLEKFHKIINQLDFRLKSIEKTLINNMVQTENITAVAAVGGMIKPLSGGTYLISEKMISDLRKGLYGEHVSNLGCLLAWTIAGKNKINAYTVDPMVVNELDPLAKLSGLPEISRKSIFKALSHKAAGRRASRELGSDYEKLNLIVGHLGKSISVAAHEKGKVIDVNNSVDGDGPFSLQKCGKLPVGDMIRLAFSGRYSREEIQFKLLKEGGVTSYLGVGEMKKINQLIDSGNENARLIYEGMAYQTAKEIGACAAALKGKVDAVVLTGDLAADKRLVNWIKERISFLGKVLVYPDDDEMLFLVQGVLRILDKQEEVKTY